MITITKDNKYFKEFRFVLSAYDKKSKFQSIKLIGTDSDKYIIVTDGRRLHKIKIEQRLGVEGHYKPEKNSALEIILEPYEDEPYKLWKQVDSLFDCVRDRQFEVFRPNPNFYMEILTTLGKYGFGVDIEYLKPLEKYSSEWTVKFDSINTGLGVSPVYFSRENIEVLIMPFRINKVEVKEI